MRPGPGASAGTAGAAPNPSARTRTVPRPGCGGAGGAAAGPRRIGFPRHFLRRPGRGSAIMAQKPRAASRSRIAMTSPDDRPEVRTRIYRAYRDYFDKAERKRRWNVREDIPWDQCNPGIDPEIADVVQTFCMVELYLPDYLSKQLPQVRNNRGRAWMLANWGYEESKHSLALEDWLVRSGHRSEKQVESMVDGVNEKEWMLKYNSPK